jgi:pimeloyl-ACP methyl ester carboxylesterase
MTHLDGAHVIAIDRPGYGWSEGGPLDYQEQIDLVPEFLKALGFTRAILVGHSFGGLLALGVACMHPDITAALALIAPSGGGLRSGPFRLAAARMVQVMQLPGARQVIEATAGGIIRRTSAEIDFRFAFRPDPGDPGYRARLSQVTLHDDNLRAMANDRLRYTKNIEWIDKQVPTIDVPSVTLLAVADRPIPIKHGRRLAAALCGTHVIELPGGHMIPYTKPAVVAKAIMQAAELAVSEPDTNPLSPNHRTDLPKEPSIKHFEKPYRSRLCARSARVRPEISPGRHRFGSP